MIRPERPELDEAVHALLDGAPDPALESGLSPAQRELVAGLRRVERGLRSLHQTGAPSGLAERVAGCVAEVASDPLAAAVGKLPRLRAPDGLAAATAARVAAEGAHLPSGTPLERQLKSLRPVSVPAGFGRSTAARIRSDARTALAVPADQILPASPAPVALVAATLGLAALVALTLAWPYASVAGSAMLEVGRSLPPTLAFSYLAAASIAVGVAAGRLRPRLIGSLAAFAIGAGIVMPQLAAYTGPGSVAPGTTVGTVFRLGGDLLVSGRVAGDAVSLGGDVRLMPGATVEGRVLTLLGDVSLAAGEPPPASVSAVLGRVHGLPGGPAGLAADRLGSGTASAVRPLRELMQARYWPALVLGLALAAAGVLVSVGGWASAVGRAYRDETGPSIATGVALALLALPVVALGGLSLVGAPAALILAILACVLLVGGLGASALEVGRWLPPAFGPADSAWRAVPALVAFAVALAVPTAGTLVWILASAWGAGAILVAWRSGWLGQALQPAADRVDDS